MMMPRAKQVNAEQQLLKKFFPGHYLSMSVRMGHGLPALGSSDDKTPLVREVPEWPGYLVEYGWKHLEPQFGVYDFSQIEEDLITTVAHGKVMAIYLEERAYRPEHDFPGPNYMNPDHPDYDSYYAGSFYIDTITNKGYKPAFWKRPVSDRFIALIEALGAAFDDHPAIAAMTVGETALNGAMEQPGYTGIAYGEHLIRFHEAAAAAFPTTIVAQGVNWKMGIPWELNDEFMETLVNNKGAFGLIDIIGRNPLNPPDDYCAMLDDCGGNYGKYFDIYKGIAPIFQRGESGTFNTQTAQIQFDYAINEIGAHFIAWQPIGAWSESATFTIQDVIALAIATQGITNPAPESLKA
jgi:hypothetical protein